MNRVIVHEAAHAASFLVDRLPLRFARSDRPEAKIADAVLIDRERLDLNHKTVDALLIGSLMGPLADGHLVHRWPVDIGGNGRQCSHDLASAAKIGMTLDFGARASGTARSIA